MKSSLRILLIVVAIAIGVELLVRLVGESLWFQEVGYLYPFLKRLGIQLGLCLGVTGLSLFFLLANLHLAQKFKWHHIPQIVSEKSRSRRKLKTPTISPQSVPLNLFWLLFILLTVYGLIGLSLLYYSQVAIAVLTPDFDLPNITQALPSPWEIRWFKSFLPYLSENIWQLTLAIVVIILLFIKTEYWLKVIASTISLLFGLIIAGNWTSVIKYFYPTTFGQLDPQFHKDISFYIFSLPLWQILYFWLGGLFLYALMSVSITYLLSAKSLSEGKFPGFSRMQLRHLYTLWGSLMAILVLYHFLNRYDLLYDSKGAVYGAGYAEAHVQQYVEICLGIIAGFSSVWLFWKAITGASRGIIPWQCPIIRRKNKFSYLIFAYNYLLEIQRRIPIYIWFIGLYLITLTGGYIINNLVQFVWVQPNELVRESPYIERNISYTRAGFNLDKIEAKTFEPLDNLTAESIKKNNLTIDNIRLWDTEPLLQTNRQLQQIRLYYRFSNAAIDRYLIKFASRVDQNDLISPPESQEEPDKITNIITTKQQVIIAPRELDYDAVPDRAKTWVNKHLVYTHGYGFTVSPVNLVAQGGLPYYFVKDIGTGEDKGALKTSSKLIQYTIPLGKPRIYYGQLTNNYVMTSTDVKELDFPSGEENVYNTYNGKGGIKIGSWKLAWRRILFSAYLRDWQMLFTRDFTNETRLLLRRNINERLQAIAPFLQYDRDPYLVVANVGNVPQEKLDNTLYWIVDAYTTSDRYPYSDPGGNKFNYIRNSVKVVIDAYNGNVNFYVADVEDPIIKTWGKIFPEMFQPLEAMPRELITHIRYPEDLFTTQSERLLIYHMTDPQVFYNREDQWQSPQEVNGKEVKPIEPYYLIMKLPDATSEEFILLHPYTPVSRPNLIAWLAARSDGDEYGKLLLYQFPKQKLVYGPNQIEALINQQPEISQQISLWNREGSKVIQGNLLVIPIEQSLLYVQPLYLEAEQNSVPTLARVIVFYDNRIVMAEKLKEALQAIFEPGKSSSAIVRPVEDL